MSPFDRSMRAIVCALCLGLFGASALAQSNSSAMVPAVKAVAAPAFLLAPGTATVALRLDPIDPGLIDSARRANRSTVAGACAVKSASSNVPTSRIVMRARGDASRRRSSEVRSFRGV